MEIIHRISISAKLHTKPMKKLQKLGIEMKGSGGGKLAHLNYFDISEDNPLWPKVESILSSAGLGLDPTWTEFTEGEILSAEWVKVSHAHLWGYPMPALTDEWRGISFNAGQECPSCGIGREQIAPIHLKSEPKLGRNHFMAIFWTYDIFARNEVFEVLSQENITGFEAYPVIHYKKKTPLKTIKQLKILNVHQPCIIDDNLVPDKAKSCEHAKYNVLTRGMLRFSRDKFCDMPDLVKTHEWFGSAHSAFQIVLASAKFVRVYMEHEWKGLSLAPIELI